MSPFPVDLAVKASALLAAAGVADAVLRRRGSAATRHLAWSIAIVGMLALPIASYALPHWQIRIPVARPASDVVERARTRAVPPSAQFPASQSIADDRADSPRFALTLAIAIVYAVYSVYAAGVLILLVRLGREPLALKRLTGAARSVGDPAWRRLLEETARQSRVRQSVRLLQSTGELMPMTFGSTHPAIVIPRSADGWTDDRRRAVLLHEMAHVARHDCLIQRLTACACALYWPHPAIWWAARRLRIECELACDDRVLAAGAGADEYAAHLLDLAHSLAGCPAPATPLAMANARNLERRLVAVLDAARNRAAIRRNWTAAAIALSIAALLPMAALRAAVVPVDRAADSGIGSLPGSSPSASTPARFAVQDFSGTWEIRLSRDGASVHLNLRTLHSSNGTTLPLARFKDLTASQISGAGTVHFSSQREAGTFVFDGVCRGGLCGGTYAFEPNASFAAELTRRGIGAPTPQQQYELALADAGVTLLDELSTRGYQKSNVSDFVRAAEHGVDLEYVRDMASLGYRVGTLDALIRLRDHGVDPSFVRGMAANGLGRLSADELVRARDHGVDPAYVEAMRGLGYGPTDLAGFITARDHGVDAAYVRGLADLGYKGVALDALVRLRDHGVDPEYVRGLTDLGYKALTVDALVRMRDHGVDPAYIRRLQQRGIAHLSVDELIQRRDRGEDG
jgi:beta-lactamase regulating signal transducer with metallopeptidase domain